MSFPEPAILEIDEKVAPGDHRGYPFYNEYFKYKASGMNTLHLKYQPKHLYLNTLRNSGGVGDTPTKGCGA
jgi:hypothetical protein